MWNEKDLFVQRILPDDSFVLSAFEKATEFFKVGILPELVGNWYSRAPTYALARNESDIDQENSPNLLENSNKLWCFCQHATRIWRDDRL